MNLPIYELEISEDLNDDIEVSVVSLVERPAIKKNFLAFAEDSFNDYPQAVKENAQRALKWADQNGWGSCGTEVGKTRANQLAKGESISLDTIQRMYSYLSRHKVDLENSKSYDDGCGKLMYDAWGGDEALRWSESVINRNAFRFEIQSAEKRIISGPLMLADTPIYRKDKTGEYYVTFSKETISKIAQMFFKKGYQSSVNLMHNPQEFVEGVTMFESWITDKQRGIEPMKGFEDSPEGSWFGSFKVDNDQVWEQVKSGDFKGFSVEGAFMMKRQAEPQKSKYQEAFEKVMEILAQVDEFWDPNQERDERGRWGSGGGSTKTEPVSAPKIPKVERSDERITKLMGMAKESGAEVDKVGKEIAGKYDGVLTPINYKSDESIARKVNDELNGDVSQVKDAVRNTAVVSYDKLDGIAKDLAREPRFQAENGGRVKIQEGPEYYGYKGIITNYRTENGTMAETQVNSPGMIYAKVSKEDALKVMDEKTYNRIAKETGKPGGVGHRYYEIIRKIDPQTASPGRIAVRNEVIKRSTEYYKSFYGF